MSSCLCCNSQLEEAKYALIDNVVYKSCPECSKSAGEHIFYKCPECFGVTQKRYSLNNPLGLQSYCAPCRSNRKGPHEEAVSCSEINKMSGHIVPEIRFLPMGKQVFPTKEQVIEFLTVTMPERGATYYYSTRKINSEPGTLFLFQYDASLLGYAMLNSITELDEPVIIGGFEYNGFYCFEPDSITIFDKTITAEDFAKIDVSFKGFSQAAKKMPAGLLPAIVELINNKDIQCTRVPSILVNLPEEIDETDMHIKEGAKKQITVNAYERNPQARALCVKHYKQKNDGKLKCEICGFDFGKTYGDMFAEKIHIHHLVEIHTIGEEYEVDATKDLIPICPNCHMIAHSKKPAYTPDEIRKMIKK